MSTMKTFREPARDIPVFRRCQVLVVGGGPAGCAAAASAAQMGAETILVARYGHLHEEGMNVLHAHESFGIGNIV